MDAGTVVAIYAAIVATCGVGWQAFAWFRARATRVKVYARMGAAAPPGGVVELVVLTVVNNSEHPVKVSGVGFEAQDGSGNDLHILKRLFHAELPGDLDPRDSGQAFITFEEFRAHGLDIMKPLTAWARLSTDQRFTNTATLMRER